MLLYGRQIFGVELAKVNKEFQTLQTRLTNAQMLMLDGAFDAAEYKGIRAKLAPDIQKLHRGHADLSAGNRGEQELKKFWFFFLRNLDKHFASADLEEKRHILGSTFPERLIF